MFWKDHLPQQISKCWFSRTPLNPGLPDAKNSCFTHTRPATSGKILNAPCFFKPFTSSLYWFYIRRVASITKSKFTLSINEQFRFVKPKHTLVFLLDRCYSRRKCCLRTKCTPESLLKEHSRHLLHKTTTTTDLSNDTKAALLH